MIAILAALIVVMGTLLGETQTPSPPVAEARPRHMRPAHKQESACEESQLPVTAAQTTEQLNAAPALERAGRTLWQRYMFDILACNTGRPAAIPLDMDARFGKKLAAGRIMLTGGSFGTIGKKGAPGMQYHVQSSFPRISTPAADRSGTASLKARWQNLHLNLYWENEGNDGLPLDPRVNGFVPCEALKAHMPSCAAGIGELPIPVTLRSAPYKAGNVFIIPIKVDMR